MAFLGGTFAGRVAACAGMLLLGACTRWDLAPVEQQPVVDDPFQSALKSAYMEKAAFERAELDWTDLLYFRDRAEAAGMGKPVEPQAVAGRVVPTGMAATFEAQRERILKLYRGRGRDRAPQDLADAQASYDCWLEQQEEGHQNDDIERCRSAFMAAIAAAEDKSVLKGDVFVLLPDDDGKLGKLAVTGAGGGDTQVLESDRAALEVRDGLARSVDVSDEELDDLFADALKAQPLPPRSFTLYFLEGKAELTPESKATLDDIAADLERRKSPEVVVIGHTDREGTVPANDRLGKRRAEAIAGFIGDFLADRDIKASRILAQGRGEREPVVPTDDGVPEPRNRRAEIVVR
ncbi:MAG: OmpA family protein [Alphaproteobacteria bacterium]